MPAPITAPDLLEAFYFTRNALERCSGQFFQNHGLTDAQFNILFILAHHEGEVAQAVLVEELLVGKATISIVLARMQRGGLVTAAKNPTDRRAVTVKWTRRGKELWHKVGPPYAEQRERVFGAVPPAARAALVKALRMLQASAEAACADYQTRKE